MALAGDLVMETLVRELISLFNDNSCQRNDTGKNIVSRIKAYFLSELTKPELDFALSVLLRRENSLLHFINKGCYDTNLKGGIKDALSLIIELLNKYTRDLVNYFIPIKDVCLEVVRRDCPAEVLKNAYEVIKEIVITKENSRVKADLDIPGLVEFLHSRGLTNKSIKPLAVQGVYELYGAIVCLHPECCTEQRSKSLVRHILQDLKTQMKNTKNFRPCVIQGCMNALRGVLTHFTCDQEDNAEQSQDIYRYVKDASTFQEEASRRVYQRAALELFTTHIIQLWHWVVENKDLEFWMRNLSLWASRSSRDDSSAGIAAMQALHRQAIMYLTTQPDDRIQNELMKYYRSRLNDSRAAHHDMDLAIEGVSALAGLTGGDMDQTDVSYIFKVVLQRALNDVQIEGHSQHTDIQLANYLKCLSNICTKLHSVSNDQLSAVTRLWRSVVECYPHHYPREQVVFARTLCATVLKMAMCGASVFDKFFYPVVYQSVIVSCSHTLVEEAELQEELTGRQVITYKNYLKLWKELFQIGFTPENKFRVPGETKELRTYVIEKLYDCFIKSLVAILEKLNVGYKRDDTLEEVKSDPENSLKSEVPQDHSVLCNLANLYRDVLASLNKPDRLCDWLPELITNTVNQSVRFPLVSAFYKLLAAVLSVAQRAGYFLDESEERQSLGQYVVRYLEDVMFHCHQYKNDLQASCLLAVISVPTPLVEPLLAGVAPVMQMIFQLGLNVLHLAHSGMDALELWQRKLSPEQLRPILHSVLPTFDPYLRSRGITTEPADDEGVQMSKRQQQRERRVQEATRLSTLQRRMLKLLSRLDSATCLGLLRPPRDTTAWSTEPTVVFRLPFPDQRLPVHFDSLLPRVTELALTSSDRQTKAAACEVLHAFVIIFIGNGPNLSVNREPELVKVLTRLVPPLLRLSCGSDLVARQLFHPLTFQLMHWFSSRTVLHGRAAQSQAVLQAVWDGITDEEDTGLQDLSALCLQEFVAWSIKQSSAADLAKSPVGPRAVVRQINMFCTHPSLAKRRGAALAFCHVAKLLREESSLVDRYWLELTYHLVCNLEKGDCHDHPAAAALGDRGAVVKVMAVHADLLNKPSKIRRVPPGLDSGLLLDLVKFLLQKCGSKTAMCAARCRGLLVKLMPLVPDCPRPEQLCDMVRVCEGAGNGSVLPIQPSFADVDHLRASLDCYAWAIKMGYISPAVAFKDSASGLVACVEYFLNLLDLTVVPPVLCSRQQTAVTKSKCDMLVALFDILAVSSDQVKLLPYTFFADKFWNLLALCVFNPHKIGFDWRNRKLSDSLNDKLRLLMCTLRDYLEPEPLSKLYSALSDRVLYDCWSCIDRLSHLCQGLLHLEIKDKQYVEGLVSLHKTDLLRHLKHGTTWDGNALVNGVFSSLFDSEGSPLYPDMSVKAFADQLLHLAVLLGADVRTTLACVMDSKEVKNPQTSASVTKGKHFLNQYEDRLIAHLLQDPSLSVTRLLEQPSAARVEIIYQMVVASKYTKVKYNRSAEALLGSLTSAWRSLDSWAGATQSRSWLVDLLQGLVLLLPPARTVGGLSTAPAHPAPSTWLFHQISDPNLKLEYKVDLIDLLPSVVCERTNAQLEEVLSHLQAQFPVLCAELRPGSVERATFVSVYTALLRTLVAAGSVAVLRVVCESAADGEHACADQVQAALVDLVKSHKDEVQTQALKIVHDMFLDDSKDVDFRLNLMSRFLIPMLGDASKAVVSQFYTDRIHTVINTLEDRLRVNDQEWRSKQQLVSKIGACRLLEPLFHRLDVADLKNSENPVNRAAKACIPVTQVAGRSKEPQDVAGYTGSVLYRMRKLTCPRAELQELFRRFQCAAYNALLLYICNTNRPEKFFAGLAFQETPPQPIWCGIVPIKPRYTFPVDYDDYPKIKKQLVQMRSQPRGGGEEATNQTPAIYLPSQSLFNSSLQEDITAYDFSLYNVRDADRMQQVLTTEDGGSATGLELEEDCLNNHECMSTLVLVVKRLCETSPTSVARGQRPQLPLWMEYLRSSLVAPDQPANCRAFIVKLIVNCESHFKPYAAHWISPIVQCVLDNSVGDRFNSLVHDIVRMFYNWRTVGLPDTTTEDKLKASEFLRTLVLRTPHERINVMKYNVELVKFVVEMWKEFVSVPYQELLDLLRPPTSAPADPTTNGILLADAFLSHDLLPFNQTGKPVYFEHLLAHLQGSNPKTYKYCAAVIGKLLRVLSDKEKKQLQGEDLEFFNRVLDAIRPEDRNRKERNDQHFITCLYQIQSFYQPVVKGFEAQCISMLNYPADYSRMLVDILTTALEFDDFRRDAFSMLTDLPRFLTDEGNPDRQVSALKLVNKLLPSLRPDQLSRLLPSVVSLRNQKRVQTRTVVFEIVSWIYDHYSHSSDEEAAAQVKEAHAVLISGLADPDKKLQDQYYSFWRQNDRLSSRSWGRLLDILRLLYTASCEPVFLTVATSMLLDLCQHADEYNRNIFDEPLSNCVFEKYTVSGSFRTQHAAFVPMFANTLSSQISSFSLGSFDFNFELRATQPTSSLFSSSLQSSMNISSVQDQSLYQSFAGPSTSKVSFGNKYKQGPSFGSDYLEGNDATDGEQETSHAGMLHKRRLVRDRKKESQSFAEYNRAKNAEQRHKKEERHRRREGEVTLTRGYRKGDLPDVQIPCSEVVTALTVLAKRDQMIARQLLVVVYKALVETNVRPDVAGVSTALDHIVRSSMGHEPPLMAAVMEMGLVRPADCRTPAAVITQVSKSSHQMSVGALLVEAKLMSEEGQPPSVKRGRADPRVADYDDWMYLAEIYHSLEEKDVVQGLFEDKIAEACSAVVQEALQAEDQARWKLAHLKYTECLTSHPGTAAENFLYEAAFKCSAHLSEWEKLNKVLKETLLENNMEEVWNDDWNRDHLLPWLFLSEIHCSERKTELSVAQDFNSALSEWLEDSDKGNHIKSKLSEMLSVLLVVRGDVAWAKVVNDASVEQFLAVWQQLDSLNNHLRGSRLLGVHKLMDTSSFLELPQSSENFWIKKVDQLLTQWKENGPSKSDNLVSWETQAVYRNIFARKLEAESARDGNDRKNFIPFKLDNYLKTLECAVKQKNFYVANNFLKKIQNEKRGKLDSYLYLSKSKVRLIRAELENSTPSKVSQLLKVWEPLVTLKEQEESGSLEYPLNRELHFHTAESYRTLLAVVRDQPLVLDHLLGDSRETLALLDLGDGDVSSSLKDKVLSCLEKAVAVSKEREVLADAYLRLTVFCHEIDDPQYRDKLIQSLLRAMKYGSSEARTLFPCLLESSLVEHADLFLTESKQVPEWMFLSWVAQLLAHLDTDVGRVVAPLLVDLAVTYPIALQFPFHLSKEMYQYKHPETRATVDRLSDLLRLDATTQDLLRGLSCVCQPHVCLMHHIERLRNAIVQNLGSGALCDAYKCMGVEAFPPDNNDKIKGEAFNAVRKFTDEIKNAYYQLENKEISTSDFVRRLELIHAAVKGDGRVDKRELDFYSPWLLNGYRGDVEIPGQYTGESKPLPSHHVTIAAFQRYVTPVRSLRCPMKITILGSDARDHPFLVKFGEDLRQDQRIQQLFGLMNQRLSADATASRRQLSVQTYSVVPLNTRLGIIEWVENTTTLKNFFLPPIEDDDDKRSPQKKRVDPESVKEKVKSAKRIYHDQHFYRCDQSNLGKIASFFQTVKKEDSTRYYLRAVHGLPPYMLRDAVLRLSTSPEAFVHHRSVMLTNHACLSVCQWLLGIGDRHLENTLVCLDSGRLLGIDFGHAFGTATQLLCIPELMPIRLTPQILNLAAPLHTSGLLKETMVHTLRVLRDSSRPLLATMAVFILEPSVDWLKAARKHEAYSSEGVDWLPQTKIALARRKLRGAHPRTVMEEDLRMGHGTRPHYGRLRELLWDDAEAMADDGLSPRQQMECLIAHATNRHILSKTFSGWGSWI